MQTKVFKLKAHEVAPLAPGRGGCIATDRITIDGRPVGYMYREQPIRQEDSGWRFLAGDETAQYMSDPGLHGVYDVNTIVNYDPDILPYLNAKVGSRLERTSPGNFRFLADDE